MLLPPTPSSLILVKKRYYASLSISTVSSFTRDSLRLEDVMTNIQCAPLLPSWKYASAPIHNILLHSHTVSAHPYPQKNLLLKSTSTIPPITPNSCNSKMIIKWFLIPSYICFNPHTIVTHPLDMNEITLPKMNLKSSSVRPLTPTSITEFHQASWQ